MTHSADGAQNQSAAVAATVRMPNPAIQGLRLPPASAIAPVTGARKAMTSAEMAMLQLHSARPSVSLSAIARAK